MFWTLNKGRYHIIGKNVLNNYQDIVLTLGKTTSMANIVVQGIVMKEEPNGVYPNSKFFVPIMESSFIDLCDSSNEDNLSLPDVVIPIFVNSQVVKKQPLWMDVLQVVTFSSVIESLKAMFLTPHARFELKSLEYGAITIELVNYLPTKFDGDILFELHLVSHLLGHFRQLQGMNRKYNGHV
jgi:hypothetical protein